MSLAGDFSELFVKDGSLTGVAVTVGILVLAPVVGRALRPVAKEVIKGGYLAGHKIREVAAHTGEHWSDLVAEAREELAAEQSGPAASGRALRAT